MARSKKFLPMRCNAEATRQSLKPRVQGFVTASVRTLIAGFVVVALATAAEAAQAEPKKEKTGGFITVRSPITSATYYSVRRQSEAMLAADARIIVFDIQPGTSDYGNCLNLAHYIESIKGANTVAFVRESLHGHAVMVALAAGELVISRNAELGDIGREEKVILPGMEAEYRELARRREPNNHQAIVLGMLDKKHQVWKVVTARGPQYVLNDELKKLENEEQIKSKEVLIETGQLGKFKGDQLRELGMAKVNLETRNEVAELYSMSPKTPFETAETGVKWRPVLIKIQGYISPLLKEYVVRHVNEAREEGRNFFIFEIDSYGGFGGPGLELAEFIKDMKGVKTVAYVPRNAISAAAFIALGCDDIVMHTDAKLGNCGVMFQDEHGQFHYAPAKEISYYSASLKALAEVKGYPPALAQAMVEKDLVVKEVRDKQTGRVTYISDTELAQRDPESLEVLRIVKDKENFLTVDGTTAVSLDLADETVDNLDGLKALYGLEEKDIHVVAPNWVDTLIAILNSPIVSMLLIVGGILGLYTELKMPGTMLPGIIAGLCFLLFFWSHVMGGTATALEIVLFLAGVICLGVELLLIPGFGVFGVTGILLIIFSIILASQTFVFPQTTSDWRTFTFSMMPLLASFASLIGFTYLISKYLPHVPILGRMVLQPSFAPGEDGVGVSQSPYEHLLGTDGVAMTMLRPAGLVRFDDQYIDVVSDGSYIDEGTRVHVIEVTGNRIVVKQVS